MPGFDLGEILVVKVDRVQLTWLSVVLIVICQKHKVQQLATKTGRAKVGKYVDLADPTQCEVPLGPQEVLILVWQQIQSSRARGHSL